MGIPKDGGRPVGSPHQTLIQDKWGSDGSPGVSRPEEKLSNRNPKTLFVFLYLLYFYILTISVSVSERRMSRGKMRLIYKMCFGDARPLCGQELGQIPALLPT